MNDVEQRKAAKEFSEFWQGKGYEKGQSQQFWMSLLSNVFGIEKPEEFISFEDQVKLDHTSFIDASIPATHVLIEQKSIDKELNAAVKQSDGSLLTPFQQAKRYAAELPYSIRPRWIVTCNFKEFYVYDMEQPNGEPEIILLKDLPKEYHRLKFLVDTGSKRIKKELELSIAAGKLVGELYEEIHKLYLNPDSLKSQQSLNILCVRLVFCLYAEDASILGGHNMFGDYLKRFEARDLRRALIDLFKVLDTPEDLRDPYLDAELAAFPYVNGGLFADENIEIPQLTEAVKTKLLENASEGFDWSGISPTIFGAVFESTLNPETRRKGGMHYTSIENIHKVIDPLFLDDLKEELANIKAIGVKKNRKNKLEEFQDKIADLTFFDPACGSGNFLTETFLSLRHLENEVLKELQGVAIVLGELDNPIKVSIGQFYGIEINDFAVTVARTALWIAEAQMMKETEDIIHMRLDFLPLKSYTNIHEGNALRMDWETVVAKNKLNYIMGNPPFVGIRHSNEEHRRDLKTITSVISKAGALDYVTAWYILAGQYIQKTNIKVAFVSTNSICQGEQAFSLWHYLVESCCLQINFAYKTFKWENEAQNQAAVHCVIIGMGCIDKNIQHRIYDNGIITKCNNINQYILPTDFIWITKRSKPLSCVPEMIKGSYPTDNGNYIFTKEEMLEFLKKEPLSESKFRRWIGSDDLLNNKERYILFLKDCSPDEIKRMPYVVERVKAVAEFRGRSSKEATRRKALTPMLLDEERVPKAEFIVVPVVSSENRRYIPLAYKQPPDMCYASAFFVEHGSKYIFGILTSNVHNAWMRVVAGRLKSDYRYSNTIVYNNFPWPKPTGAQKAKIEATAQAILDARALYPDSSLADLYDELTMPPELRKAHQNNDKAVMEAYGFDWRNMSESDCVAELMKLYQQLVSKEK
ncbi:DNA methyltransferase [Phascolarctobacterium faecium]|jgi:hypothetical protein|uniref:DNA methyltransferase n=1 Tax=Phascolarctobacterium faecium TaxID=33025 RepID=UPI00266ED7FE|nr:DNA methyltransferase [Phascolarctobacterium faecium]